MGRARDVTFDDPVGLPTKHGLDAVRDSWERSIMRNEGDLEGRQVVVESIEIWTVGDGDGWVRAVRAYSQPDPSVNTDHFVPQTS